MGLFFQILCVGTAILKLVAPPDILSEEFARAAAGGWASGAKEAGYRSVLIYLSPGNFELHIERVAPSGFARMA